MKLEIYFSIFSDNFSHETINLSPKLIIPPPLSIILGKNFFIPDYTILLTEFPGKVKYIL